MKDSFDIRKLLVYVLPMNKTNNEKKTKNIRATARAFTGQSRREYDMVVNLEDKSVLVWDVIAGHYSSCHKLSKSAKARIFNIAAEEPSY